MTATASQRPESNEFTTIEFDTIDDLVPAEIIALAPQARLYDSVPWLQYCERAPRTRMRYVGLRDHAGDLVGLAAMRLVPDNGAMSLYNLGSLVAGDATDSPLDVFPNLLGAVSGTHCVLLCGDVGGEAEDRILRALVLAVARVAERHECRTFGFLYLTDYERAASMADVLDSGAPFLADANTELRGGWPNFEGYLGTLSSSSRTKRRRERRRFLESGLTMTTLEGVAELGEVTAGLQMQLRDKYDVGGSVAQILQDYRALGSCVDDRVRVFLCKRDGVPIGMSLALVDGDRLHVRLSGFDYEQTGRDFVYFNTTFYEPIEWGIAHGITSYCFGTGTYRAKVERGCSLVPVFGVVSWPQDLVARAETRLDTRARAMRAELEMPGGVLPEPPWPSEA